MCIRDSDDIEGLPANVQVIKIPNIGLEPFSYLTHIVTQYDQLKDRVLFVQGTPYDHPVYLPLSLYNGDIVHHKANIIAKCERTTLKSEMEAMERTAAETLAGGGWKTWDNGKYADVVTRRSMQEFLEQFISRELSPETEFCINWGAEFLSLIHI